MPLLHIFESIFIFFLLVAWIWAVVGVISDVFRSSDLSSVSKAIWVFFIIIIPWLGVLSYIFTRGKGMEERNAQTLADAQEAQRTYIQGVVGVSTADELSKLAELKNNGTITDAEFESQKAKLLS